MTLWRKLEKGDIIQHKETGYLCNVAWPEHFNDRWYSDHKEKYEFVSVTPIEPPPEPLKRSVYVPVYRTTDPNGKPMITAGNPIIAIDGTYVADGATARDRTSGYAHRVGIIKVELVEGQYDD